MTALSTLRAVDAVTTDAALRLAVLRLIEALEEARRERDLFRLLYLASLDGLSLVATAPERYEQQQRELRKERETFMAEDFKERVA